MIGVRGVALPGGEPIELYADGDRWTTEHTDGAGSWWKAALVDLPRYQRRA